jgi:hypothetical protein
MKELHYVVVYNTGFQTWQGIARSTYRSTEDMMSDLIRFGQILVNPMCKDADDKWSRGDSSREVAVLKNAVYTIEKYID